MPVKTNTQAPQITQNQLPGNGFGKKIKWTKLCYVRTVCIFCFIELRSFGILKPLKIFILNFLLRNIPPGRAVYSFKIKVKPCADLYFYIYINIYIELVSKKLQNATHIFPYLITSVFSKLVITSLPVFCISLFFLFFLVPSSQ